MNVRPLSPSDDRSNFDCGKPRYNDYLKQRARQAQSKGWSTTFVAEVDGKLAGFMTVTATSIVGLPRTPRHPIAALRIAQLAVDVRFQRRGVGSALLRKAFELAKRQREVAGCYAVVLDADGADAVALYQRFGFVEEQAVGASSRDTVPMILTLATLERAELDEP